MTGAMGAVVTVVGRYQVNGKEYVVIAAGGDGETWGASDAIVAFALPR